MPPHETHAPSVAQYEPEGAKWRHAVHADAASKQQAQAAVIAIDAVVTDHVRHQCHRSPFVGLVGLQHKSRPNSRNAQRGALATAGVVCPLGRRRPSARGSMHTIFDPCFTEESVPGPLYFPTTFFALFPLLPLLALALLCVFLKLRGPYPLPPLLSLSTLFSIPPSHRYTGRNRKRAGTSIPSLLSSCSITTARSASSCSGLAGRLQS